MPAAIDASVIDELVPSFAEGVTLSPTMPYEQVVAVAEKSLPFQALCSSTRFWGVLCSSALDM